MSIIAAAVSWHYDHLLFWVAILGTVWWFLLSRVAEMVFKRAVARWSRPGLGDPASRKTS
jgi:hypothetical protein